METPAGKLTTGRVVAGIALLAAVGLIGGYGVAMRSRPKPLSLDLDGATSKAGRPPVQRIFVHVAGAVYRPGLYHVRQGSRVNDAIAAAGGAKPDADLDALNLATRLRDGDKVLVPEKGAAAADAGGGAGGKINLNTATVEQLDSLPGIGPSLAQRIIAYRSQNGGFRTVGDLQKVAGIGPAKFGSIKDLVTV